MTRWPHQIQGVKNVMAALYDGVKRVILTSPTGGGKSVMMQDLIQEFLSRDGRVVLYSNRRLLIEQLSRSLSKAGFDHGVRARGHDDLREHPLQISSIQTEISRTLKKKTWQLHDAQLVLVDEGHLHGGHKSQEIIKAHLDAGAGVVYVTATPLGMGALADKLVIAGVTSALRKCGALVEAHVYAPDEPDFKAFKKLQAKLEAGQDVTPAEARAAMMTPGIFGRVWGHYERLNPDHKPALLFAPGVEESIWFAQQFTHRGVRAAHIDGEHVWFDQELQQSNSDLRDYVLRGCRDGSIGVLCNRFVLREGIDLPFLAHGILATVFGSLQSYLQSVGRLLRACEGLTSVTIQDHGGNYWRHGSPNADRDWFLNQTADMAYGARAERLRGKKCVKCKHPLTPGNPWCVKCSALNEIPPSVCPECQRVFVCGKCPGCGFVARGRKLARPVVSTDGTLKMVGADCFPARRVCTTPSAMDDWERMYYRSSKGKGIKTFNQACALYAMEHHWAWPDRSWPLMPIDPADFYQNVPDVPKERLIPRGG